MFTITSVTEAGEWVAELLRCGATRAQCRVLVKNRMDVALHEKRWAEVEAMAGLLNSEVFA